MKISYHLTPIGCAKANAKLYISMTSRENLGFGSCLCSIS